MLVIQALGRLKKENCEFEANLGYLIRPCLKEETKQQQQKKSQSRVKDKVAIFIIWKKITRNSMLNLNKIFKLHPEPSSVIVKMSRMQ
jgi:hypothetical protein